MHEANFHVDAILLLCVRFRYVVLLFFNTYLPSCLRCLISHIDIYLPRFSKHPAHGHVVIDELFDFSDTSTCMHKKYQPFLN